MQINAVEAFKTAMNVEVIGEAFYTKAAEKTSNIKAEEIFLILAAEERDHQAEFKEIAGTIEGMDDELARYADSEEVDGYLDAVLKTNIFNTTSIDSLMAQVKEDVDAVKIGIEAEKNAILFYSGLLDIFKNPKVLEMFTKTLKEEKRHLTVLTDVLEKMG